MYGVETVIHLLMIVIRWLAGNSAGWRSGCPQEIIAVAGSGGLWVRAGADATRLQLPGRRLDNDAA